MESLFNDASGIILLNMGVLWYLQGSVRIGQTIWAFLYSAIGGDYRRCDGIVFDCMVQSVADSPAA